MTLNGHQPVTTSTHSIPQQGLLALLTDKETEAEVPQLVNDLARPDNQGHVSGYSLDRETDPSYSQLLGFCLGGG